jgi:hypothetical protein
MSFKHGCRRFALLLSVALTGIGLGGLTPSYAQDTGQSAREKALEERVEELERLVRELGKRVPPTSTTSPAPTPGTAVSPAQAPAAVAATTPGPPAAQSTSITPNSPTGTTFMYTGYVKADALFTKSQDGEIADPSPGRDYYVPSTIPVGGIPTSTQLNAHVKQTRLQFGTDTPVGTEKVSTRVEVDLFGSSLGDRRVTNTYGLQLRHAYITYGGLLVGQTWTNFMDVATLPDSVDYIGANDGTVFIRQPQVRYSIAGFSFSLEDPETTLTPNGGGDRIVSNQMTLPDVVARYTLKGAWGQLSLAALGRQLKYQRTTAPLIDDSTVTGAASLFGKFLLGKDDIRFAISGGNLGRYAGLNFVNDGVIDSQGNLKGIDGVAGFIAYRHLWSSRLRSSIWFAEQRYNNNSVLTGATANKLSRSFAANLWYAPIPKLEFGGEFLRGRRELESGRSGSLSRVELTTKYSF